MPSAPTTGDKVLAGLLRITGITVTSEDVRAKAYGQDLLTVPPSAAVADEAAELLLQYAQASFDRAEKRRAMVDEKFKFLFGAVAFAMPLTTALNTLFATNGWLVLPIGFLLATGVLLIVHFRVEPLSRPTIDVPDQSALIDKPHAQRLLAEKHLLAANANERSTNFHVDLFRASLRLFVVAVLAITGLGLWATFNRRLVPVRPPHERLLHRPLPSVRRLKLSVPVRSAESFRRSVRLRF